MWAEPSLIVGKLQTLFAITKVYKQVKVAKTSKGF